MKELSSIIADNFNGYYGSYLQSSSIRKTRKSAFMPVPIDQEIIRLPVFILSSLANLGRSLTVPGADTLVVGLECMGAFTSYKSVDSNVRNILNSDFYKNRLARIDSLKTYFGTQGAVFDEDFNPVMLMYWEIGRTLGNTTPAVIHYDFLKPVLWVSPQVVISKSDPVERYIINRIVPTVLSLNGISAPRMVTCFGNTAFKDFQPSVIMGCCPFAIKETEAPSVSTSNSELLQIALDYQKELTQ